MSDNLADMKLRQIADIRHDLNQSQVEFWVRFWANQRSGSRIERGQARPNRVCAVNIWIGYLL